MRKILSTYLLLSLFLWSCKNGETKNINYNDSTEKIIKSSNVPIIGIFDLKIGMCKKDFLDKKIRLKKTFQYDKLSEYSTNLGSPYNSNIEDEWYNTHLIFYNDTLVSLDLEYTMDNLKYALIKKYGDNYSYDLKPIYDINGEKLSYNINGEKFYCYDTIFNWTYGDRYIKYEDRVTIYGGTFQLGINKYNYINIIDSIESIKSKREKEIRDSVKNYEINKIYKRL